MTLQPIVPAMRVTEAERREVLRRLERIEGQVRGIKRMVEEERPCVEVLTQISAAHEALRSVAKIVMHKYLTTCATHAIRGSKQEIYDELMNVIFKFAK